MSFSGYRRDLAALVERIQAEGQRLSLLPDPNSNWLDDSLVRDSNSLIEDLRDYSYSQDLERLGRKVDELRPNWTMATGPSELDELKSILRRIDRAIIDYSESGGNKSELASQPLPTFDRDRRERKKVFVVHGHDEAILHQVCRLIEGLHLKPVVLREEPNGGKTVIEKFEQYSDVEFSVVLMTGDDKGASLADAEKGLYRERARQNVLLELGFFVAKLGRKNVSVLKAEHVEVPSDILGIVYTPMENSGAWRLALAKELKHSGFEVDLNRVSNLI